MFDYIIIGFYILSLMYGWRKGALKIIYKFFSLFLSFYLTKLLYPYVKDFFYNRKFNEVITESIGNIINIEAADGLTVYEKRNLLESLNLPNSVSNYIIENNNIETYTSLGVEKFNDYIVAMISNIVSSVIVIIILFIAIFAILSSIKIILNFIDKIPLIGEVNRAIGSILQAVLFTIYLCIFNLVLAITVPFSRLDTIREFVEGSFFGNYETVSNVMLKFVLSFFS